MSDREWPKIVGVKASALHEWAELVRALDRIDGRTPCASDPVAWTSDDAEERAVAVRACMGCLLIEQCGAFAEANGETAHVYGGMDFTQTRAASAVSRRTA